MADVRSEIADYLVANGVGTAVGTDVFRGFMPPLPDVCVGVYETGGSAPENGFGTTGLLHEFPNVQIIVRGAPKDYATPRATADVAWRKLAEIQGTTLGSTKYLIVLPLQSPAPLSKDARLRWLIAFNARCEKELS